LQKLAISDEIVASKLNIFEGGDQGGIRVVCAYGALASKSAISNQVQNVYQHTTASQKHVVKRRAPCGKMSSNLFANFGFAPQPFQKGFVEYVSHGLIYTLIFAYKIKLRRTRFLVDDEGFQ
jgi:hypothetical protein